MHEGCSGSFENGRAVVDKVRMMGFAPQHMPMPITVECHECGKPFDMETFEDKCPECGAIHAVTPCHSHDPASIQCAGKDY